jgi:hypothetical protein
MRIYIAGRITGNEERYREEFAAAAALLTAQGHEAVNPAENPPQPSWRAYMVVSIKQLLDCDGIAVLPRWWRSRGARLEFLIAWALGMPRAYL